MISPSIDASTVNAHSPRPNESGAPDATRGLRVAVLIPCYNEALAVGQVISDFRAALPHAQVHVFDNASSDDTATVARAHDAQVAHVALRGKGNVVRRMFADVEADVYLMVDGDATYDAAAAPAMIAALTTSNLDMVVGARIDDPHDEQTYRPGHRLGNRLLTRTVTGLFGGQFTDMLSGYRVLSRRYAKSFPALAAGFEIETELTVHALELRMPHDEYPTRYVSRPDGSHSKLSTYRDGWRILVMILRLFINERPLSFFSTIGAVLALLSVGLATPIFITWLSSGLVPRLPTAVLSTGLMLGAMLSVAVGSILRTVTLGRREVRRLAYLAVPGIRATLDEP